MRDKGGNITALQTVSLQKLLTNLGLLAHRKLEHCLPVLMNKVHVLPYGFVGGRIQTASPRHVKRASAGAIHLMNEIDDSQRVVIGRLQDHSPCSIPED